MADHEGDGVDAGRLGRVALLTTLMLFIIVAVCQMLLWSLQVRRPAVPLAIREAPPEPRLDPVPHEAWQAYQTRSQAWLASYGWIDRPGGVVHLPIERAMDLVLQEGLKPR